jgi:hypothetical protein
MYVCMYYTYTLFASANGSISVSDLTVGVGTAGGANLVTSKFPAALKFKVNRKIFS